MDVKFFGEKARHPSPPVVLLDGSSSTAPPTSKIRGATFLKTDIPMSVFLLLLERFQNAPPSRA